MRGLTNLAIRRFLARAIDQSVFTFLIYYLFEVDDVAPVLLSALFFAYVPVDAMLTWAFGRTLGKLLLRIRVVAQGGQGISLRMALERSIRVWFFGQSAGITVLMPFTGGILYNRYLEKGVTSWDSAVGTNVVVVDGVPAKG